MIFLNQYGWNTFHQQNYDNLKTEGQSLGRVISVKGFKYELITQNGELETELSGRLLFGAASEDLPKVGDWVCYLDYGQTGYVVSVLPRMNALSRKTPGAKTEKQILGTNIDFALIVQGLDSNFNPMRLERYLAQVSACGINARVILNKADLATDLQPYLAEISKLKRDCEVSVCSTHTGFGIAALRDAFQINKTYILVGSSGVGKSSLLNIFMDAAVQRISSTSDANNKGRHTTTTRDLFQLANGSLIIDSPGMREFGLTNEEGESSGSLFPAIEEFASTCRYADCKHLNELGCSVLSAVNEGALDATVYESYLKLIKEQKRFETKVEDRKRLGKQSGKVSREANNYRKKYKY